MKWALVAGIGIFILYSLSRSQQAQTSPLDQALASLAETHPELAKRLAAGISWPKARTDYGIVSY